jgi:succinate-acetate transporter protein
MSFRVLALALAVVLLVTFATPAKAEAIEPFTILAIAGAAIIVIVLIVYLVVANVENPKMSESQPLPGPLVAAEQPPLVFVAVDVPREGP